MEVSAFGRLLPWLAAGLVACTRHEPAPRPHAVSAVSSPASAVAPEPGTAETSPAPSASEPPPPPLEGEGKLVSLDVEGFLPAVVSVPTAARAVHPVAVALHGNFDRPEWQCEVFRPVIGEAGFLVCPRGVPRRDVPKRMDRWEYASGAKVAAEIDAALSALAARYPGRVDPDSAVLIGFSLGAIYGSPLLQKEPARFPRAVLVEGGHGAWNAATAKRFAAGGGKRLFLACGQAACLSKAARLVKSLEQAGLPTQSGGSKTAGHTYDGDVAASVKSAWPWLVEGDHRWSP